VFVDICKIKHFRSTDLNRKSVTRGHLLRTRRSLVTAVDSAAVTWVTLKYRRRAVTTGASVPETSSSSLTLLHAGFVRHHMVAV